MAKESANSFSTLNTGPVSLVSPDGQPVFSMNALNPDVYLLVSSYKIKRYRRTWMKYVFSLVASCCLPNAVIRWSACAWSKELAQWMTIVTINQLANYHQTLSTEGFVLLLLRRPSTTAFSSVRSNLSTLMPNLDRMLACSSDLTAALILFFSIRLSLLARKSARIEPPL